MFSQKKEDDSDEDSEHYVIYVSFLLESMFSNCEVYFDNTSAYKENGLYPHKAQISNEFNSSVVSKKRILTCHGYSFEELPESFDL